MFRWPRLFVLLLLTLPALVPAAACHAAPPPAVAAAHAGHHRPDPARHSDTALAAPCLGCVVPPARAVAAVAAVPLMIAAPPAPRLAALLRGRSPLPADRPPRRRA